MYRSQSISRRTSQYSTISSCDALIPPEPMFWLICCTMMASSIDGSRRRRTRDEGLAERQVQSVEVHPAQPQGYAATQFVTSERQGRQLIEMTEYVGNGTGQLIVVQTHCRQVGKAAEFGWDLPA